MKVKKARVYWCCGCSKQSKFTLVELLIVIGIIVILVSLLLPALNKAKEKAQAAGCRNNLRQLYLCLNSYADDWNGYFPKMYDLANVPWTVKIKNYNWKGKLMLCTSRLNSVQAADTMGQFNNYAYGTSYYYNRPERILDYYNKSLPPSKTYLCGDALNFRYISAGNYWQPYPQTSLAAQLPNFPLVHSGKVNVLFWDSHVDLKSYADRGDMNFMHLAGW